MFADDSELHIISQVFDIYNLSRDNLYFMIINYKAYIEEYPELKRGFLSKMNIKDYNHYSSEFEETVDNYLDSLNYESIYERELDIIIKNLPNLCLSNIYNKKINDIKNLIDSNDEYIEVN